MIKNLKTFSEHCKNEDLNLSIDDNKIDEGIFDFFAKKRTAHFSSPIGNGKAHFSGINYDESDIKKYIQSELSEKGHAVSLKDIKIIKVE